jgi:uncharacterized protein YbjT (DUF2867 family)
MKCVVTGAYGYSGKYIAHRLLAAGATVSTLTHSPEKGNPFGDKVKASPFNFDKPDLLTQSLQGTDVLVNTYWVRFNTREFTHADAVRNSGTLFTAARRAGVKRVVHISIANPSEDSPYEYYRGKAAVEKLLIGSGLSHAILRPTVLFGQEDILINNIAWTLRHLPVFGVFGNGRYKIQPIYVDDLAALAEAQSQTSENAIINAIGPETFTFRDLVATIGDLIGKRRPILPVPRSLGYLMTRLIGWVMHDIFLTKEEMAALMDNKLYVSSPPAGNTRLTDWIRANAATLGRKYASEWGRRRAVRSDTSA